MTGEERARKISSDLVTARLIAGAIQKRRGRPRQEHRLFGDPDEIFFHPQAPNRPIFVYYGFGAYRVEGEEKRPYLSETRVGGPTALRRRYDGLGRFVSKDAIGWGDPRCN
jgi:hypothetical protein